MRDRARVQATIGVAIGIFACAWGVIGPAVVDRGLPGDHAPSIGMFGGLALGVLAIILGWRSRRGTASGRAVIAIALGAIATTWLVAGAALILTLRYASEIGH